jgi:hypothetical protein
MNNLWRLLKVGHISRPVLVCLTIGLMISSAQAAQVTVETKILSSPVADPFLGFVSVGPKYEYEPVYRMPEPGACSILAYRVLILRYANYNNIVVEELGFSGGKCQDIKVRKSFSVKGVTLGYALGEGTRFAWNLEFKSWKAWDTFAVRSENKEFRIRLGSDGVIFAEPIDPVRKKDGS